ncbi:MAG TPA: hypothetical protein VLP43_07285 [Solirubrobacteraceae bacterium]|nr:hypothetical protein [Solirubrobacteraceae bacterium]
MRTSARVERSPRVDTFATRLMGALFGFGAAGFVIGPLDTYVGRVGSHADELTFLIASILFTAGGLTQLWLAYPERRVHRAGLLAWRAAWVQSVGTLLFNFMTLEAISRAASDAQYNLLVWTPNALGSACFLTSGVLLYFSAPRAGWRPLRHAAGWWEPPVNLLGCVLFGVSAVAAYAINSSGQLLDLTTANWTTTFGAACFLAVALAAVIVGMTFKIPRLSRLVAFERTLQRKLADAGHELELDARRDAFAAERSVEAAGDAVEPEMVKLEREGEQELARVERVVKRERPTELDID